LFTNREDTTPGRIPAILQVFETLAKFEDSRPEEKKRTTQERRRQHDLRKRVRKALVIICCDVLRSNKV
jgi:hypothetical protein